MSVCLFVCVCVCVFTQDGSGCNHYLDLLKSVHLGTAALASLNKFHHWLMLYTLAEYIVNVQSSTTSDRFLTVLTFGIRGILRTSWKASGWPVTEKGTHPYSFIRILWIPKKKQKKTKKKKKKRNSNYIIMTYNIERLGIGGIEKHEICVGSLGGHLFYDWFLQALPPPDVLPKISRTWVWYCGTKEFVMENVLRWWT